MQRGGILLAAALMLALSTSPAAAGQSGAQPDLMIVSRHGEVLNGDDIYNDTGVGQQRSVTVDQRLTVVLRLENDGDARGDFDVLVRAELPSDFRVQIRARGSAPIISPDAAGVSIHDLDPDTHRDLRLVLTVNPDASLGSELDLSVVAAPTSTRVGDAVLIKVTKTSTPSGIL